MEFHIKSISIELIRVFFILLKPNIDGFSNCFSLCEMNLEVNTTLKDFNFQNPSLFPMKRRNMRPKMIYELSGVLGIADFGDTGKKYQNVGKCGEMMFIMMDDIKV